MSYCVNCGVELDKSAKKCPLCDTIVYNPNVINNENDLPPLPDKPEIPPSTSKKYLAFIISMVMLIPNIVFFLSNFLFRFDNKYLMMLNATSILLWVLFVFPLFKKKGTTLLFVSADAITAIGYTYIIYKIVGGKGWFLGCAVPLIILVAIMCAIFIEWLHHGNKGKLTGAILFFGEVGVSSVITELILNRYLIGQFKMLVSVIIMACCLAIIGFFIAVSVNSKLKSWIRKKFFIN